MRLTHSNTTNPRIKLQAARDVTNALKRGLNAAEAGNHGRVKRFAACERACLAHLMFSQLRGLLVVGGARVQL